MLEVLSSENLELSPVAPVPRFTPHPYPSPFTVCPAGNDLSSVLDSLSPMAHSPQHSARQDAPCPKQGRGSSADPRFTFHISRFTAPLICILLALLCLVGTACGTTGPTGKILFDDPRGTVSLQTMSDRSIQANHPINLDPNLLAQLLRGIEIQEQEHGLQKLITRPSAPVPVFSDDQIRFLAPLLAEGLRTATPDQRIEYRVNTTHKGSVLESSTTETTAGSLYAYGRQMYVILSQYNYNQMRENMNVNDMSNRYRSRQPDSSGLQDYILLFTPRTAQRSDSFDPPAGEKSTDRFLAVDYQLLQQASPALATTEQTAPVSESSGGTGTSGPSTQSTEALAQEVEALKKEMQSLKQQQLNNQTTGPDSPKQKTTPQQK